MKKVLIISYHSLPMDVISSYRAMAYLRYLKKDGYYPILLTHFWDNKEHSQPETENYEYGEIIRVPIIQNVFSKTLSMVERIPMLNKFSILLRWLTGHLDSKADDIASYFSFKQFSKENIDFENIEFVIGIFSPHHQLKLSHYLYKKYGVQYVLDFRDLWDNRVIHTDYSPNFTEKLQDRITWYYWKKWLKHASFFTITSEPWRKFLNDLTETKGYVIHNGFEPDLFQLSAAHKTASNDIFTIVHAGSLYEHQNLEIFLHGCQMFITDHQPQNFQVLFIGGDRPGAPREIKTGYKRNAKKYVNSIIDIKYCKVIKRIPKEEVVRELLRSQILYFPSFPNSPGTYASKIFDYLAAKKNIVVVPSDNGVVDELVTETKSGAVLNTSSQVYNFIQDKYLEWQKDGRISYKGDNEKIGKYSRESQVARMAQLLDKHSEGIATN